MTVAEYAQLIINNNITVEMVVRKYYTNKIGKSKLCECPFHTSTKKKSLVVSPQRDPFFFKCFGCDISGDTLEFVSKYCNMAKPDAAKMICQDFGIIESECNIQFTPRQKIKMEFQEKEILLDLTSFILDANKTNNGFNYFYNERKISKKIINKYKLCRINPINLIGKNYLPKLDMSKYSYILPLWYKQKVISIICRRSDGLIEQPRYANLKGVPMYIFNVNKILAENINQIYICESILDALSIESLGGHAISLNSTSNRTYIKDFIKHNLQKCKNKMFILCGDQDEAGEKMNKYLSAELKKLKITHKIFPVQGDINEMHMKNILKLD